MYIVTVRELAHFLTLTGIPGITSPIVKAFIAEGCIISESNERLLQ